MKINFKKNMMLIILLYGFSSLGDAKSRLPEFKKVMIVVLENTDFDRAMKEPVFVQFAKRGALLEDYRAVTHPSQPNYFAIVSGKTFVTSNNDVDLNESHLGDLLEKRGLSWKTYAEGYPGNCFLGSREGLYERKHNPFISFTNVNKNPKRCAQVVSSTVLDEDVKAGKLPNFSLYIPDGINSGHDKGVTFAANWFKSRFEPLMNNPYFMHEMLLVVTFDEGSYRGNNRVYTAFVGHAVKRGAVSSATYNHYSLLHTLEKSFRLGSLDREDKAAKVIDDIWQN
jgi:hypothetical protein